MIVPPPPPARRRRRPWYAQWWAIVLYAVVGLCMIGGLVGALGDDGGDGALDEVVEDMNGAADSFAEEAEGLGPVEFGETFAAITETGSGDATVALPEGAEEGTVTAVYDGGGNSIFSIDVIDDNNESTGDFLVTTMGDYQGTTAFGLYDLGNEPDSLKITADGDWEITIASFEQTPYLELPAEGQGDAVYRYDGGAADWTLTHDGDSVFTVGHFPFTGIPDFNLLVMEMGRYEGTVPVTDDVAVVTITADGSWTITAS